MFGLKLLKLQNLAQSAGNGGFVGSGTWAVVDAGVTIDVVTMGGAIGVDVTCVD